MDFTVALTQETRAAGERRGEKNSWGMKKIPLAWQYFWKNKIPAPLSAALGGVTASTGGFCFLGGNQQSDELPTLHQNLRVTAEI